MRTWLSSEWHTASPSSLLAAEHTAADESGLCSQAFKVKYWFHFTYTSGDIKPLYWTRPSQVFGLALCSLKQLNRMGGSSQPVGTWDYKGMTDGLNAHWEKSSSLLSFCWRVFPASLVAFWWEGPKNLQAAQPIRNKQSAQSEEMY